jgi:hypothetical protein
MRLLKLQLPYTISGSKITSEVTVPIIHKLMERNCLRKIIMYWNNNSCILKTNSMYSEPILRKHKQFLKRFICSLYILVLHCGNSCVKNVFPRMSNKRRIEFYCSLEIERGFWVAINILQLWGTIKDDGLETRTVYRFHLSFKKQNFHKCECPYCWNLRHHAAIL